MASRIIYGARRLLRRAERAAQPSDALIAAAIAHARGGGRLSICVAAPFALAARDVERLAGAAPVTGIVGRHSAAELQSLREAFPTANFGVYRDPGLWLLPEGAAHVYFLASWRLVTLAMLRELVRRQTMTLSVLSGRRWVDFPLSAVCRLAALRRVALRGMRALPAAARIVTRTDAHRPAPLDAALVSKMIATAARERPADCVPGRVVLVCGNLSPGGAERQVAYTARGLAQDERVAQVQVLCDMLDAGHPARYGFYLPILQRAGVPTRVVERFAFDRRMVEGPAALAAFAASLPEGLLLDVANLYREFVRLRPEIVHAWLDWSNTRAGLAAALAGVPRIVLSGRNVDPTHFALYQPYMDPVYEALCALPNVLLLNNSRAGADSYAAWLRLPPDRIKVVYNGLDMGEVDEAAAQAIRVGLGVPQAAPLVGGIFRLYPEKRPLLWVEVAARVLRTNPDAWFVLFGQGILQPEIEQAARDRGIADRLLLPGITGEVLAAMRAFDVFLLTSHSEGVPNVVLEAQWAGTPVVATRAGGVAEALQPGMTGWIVDPPDAAELARCVGWLLGDAAARARAAAAGPEFVRARFGLRRMIDETMQAYRYASAGRVAPREEFAG